MLDGCCTELIRSLSRLKPEGPVIAGIGTAEMAIPRRASPIQAESTGTVAARSGGGPATDTPLTCFGLGRQTDLPLSSHRFRSLFDR